MPAPPPEARIALARSMLSISAPEYVEDPSVTNEDILAQAAVQDALAAFDHAWPTIARVALSQA